LFATSKTLLPRSDARARFRKDATEPVIYRAGPVYATRQGRQIPNQGIFTQIAHHPLGLIFPSTVLQALGASNCRQLSHCWSPFGLSWYWTDAWDAFAAYAFLLTGITPIAASAAMLLSADRRVILDLSFMVFLF
jgi:hypothetical protein